MAYEPDRTKDVKHQLLDAIEYAIANGPAVLASGLPTSGEDVLGPGDDSYATVVTAPARQCHHLHVAVGDGGARISLDDGATVHFYVPANVERLFSGLVIPSGAVVKAKKLVDGGTQYTNCFASVW